MSVITDLADDVSLSHRTWKTLRAEQAGGLVEVAAGVYAYVQPDGGWCVTNTGIIVGGETTILFDSVATQGRAERLRESIDTVAPPGQNRTIMVNSHQHSDHSVGSSQFPSAVTIAPDLAREELVEGGPAPRGLWPTWPGAGPRSCCPRSPSTTR